MNRFRLKFLSLFGAVVTLLAVPADAAFCDSTKLSSAKSSVVQIFDDQSMRMCGFGFLMSPSRKKERLFLITCGHVLRLIESGKAKLRFDSFPGHTKPYLTVKLDDSRNGAKRNTFLPKDPSIDLAAIEIDVPPSWARCSSFTPSDIVDSSSLTGSKVVEGKEVFVLSPLPGYPGKDERIIVTRFGRIVLLTNEKWYDCRNKELPEKALLIDAHMTNGSSGSPVFLCSSSNICLLGVVKGAPDTICGKVITTDQHVEIPQSVTALEPGNSLNQFLNELHE